MVCTHGFVGRGLVPRRVARNHSENCGGGQAPALRVGGPKSEAALTGPGGMGAVTTHRLWFALMGS